MAITKIKPIKVRLDHVINYASNDEKTLNKEYGVETYKSLHDVLNYVENDFKTEKKLYVTGINCDSDDAYECMQITRNSFNKKGGILAFHLIQSFDKEKNVTPEVAHQIGIELCNELFADRFECLVATHLNTNHYHNHIIINSVSFRDGKKYYDNHETYSAIRRVSDNLCKEYGLKVLQEKKTKGTNLNYDNFYKKYASENNYKNTTKKDIDFAISQAFSFEDFKSIMKKLDYEVIFRYGKISVRHKKYKRNIRIERAFGEDYSLERLNQRIFEEESTRLPFIDAFKFKSKAKSYTGTYRKSKKKITGIIALYYHYCFLLKVFPNKKQRHLSASMRAEVSKMESYSEQAKFLSKNNINNINDLNNYKDNLKQELTNITSKRIELWRKVSKLENKTSTYNEIGVLTATLELKRKEMGLVEEIEARIPKMKEDIQELKSKEKSRKENFKNERIK